MDRCIIGFDSKTILELLEKMLEKLGIETIAFDDGNDVLDYYYQNKDSVELIIISYALAGIDGIDVLHKIRAESKDKPKIIISSPISNQYQIEESLIDGADDYLIKPFDEDILESKLKILEFL